MKPGKSHAVTVDKSMYYAKVTEDIMSHVAEKVANMILLPDLQMSSLEHKCKLSREIISHT